MTRFHLVISIFNPFFEGKKMDARTKINSVWFYDYDYFFEKVLNDLSMSDIHKFKLNLFNHFKGELSCLRVSQFVDGEILEGWCIPSFEYNVPSNVIAQCIPSRFIREKYFDYDCLKERWYVKSSFINYLKQ